MTSAPQESTGTVEPAEQPVAPIPQPTFEDDGWYTDERSTGDMALPAPSGPELDVRVGSQPPGSATGISASIIAALIGLIGLIAGAGWLLWRRRWTRPVQEGLDGTSLTAGVRQSIAETQSKAPKAESAGFAARREPRPLTPAPRHEPAPAPAAPPAGIAEPGPRELVKLDLQLDIVSAARSVMKFSLEFRLNISNRSSHAVRDLAITSTLASARRDSGIAMPNGEQPVQLVERIGPHQSRSVTGMLEVPWKEVHALRQGQTPLFVPLLLVTIEASGLPKHTRSFVIGTPSAASQAKLHPIPLDTPPGGVSGLRAREVKQVEAKQPA